MIPQNRQSDTKRSTANMPSMSGLVIAAIGFQLLLCSAASAACTSTIDRIPSSVAHAFREIVDRQIAQDHQIQVFNPGYRLLDCDLAATSTTSIDPISPTAQIAGQWLLNMPPPAMG